MASAVSPISLGPCFAPFVRSHERNTVCSVFRAVREKPRTKHGLRELREHRALRDSCSPPAARDRANVTGCRQQPGRRWEEGAASNFLITIRNVKMRIAVAAAVHKPAS
jgi:hypothetical protein